MCQKKKNVRQDSGNGQDGPLPLPPPPLLLVEFTRGLGEEHDVLFALDLPLEELQRGAVEAHDVLRAQRKGESSQQHLEKLPRLNSVQDRSCVGELRTFQVGS